MNMMKDPRPTEPVYIIEGNRAALELLQTVDVNELASAVEVVVTKVVDYLHEKREEHDKEMNRHSDSIQHINSMLERLTFGQPLPVKTKVTY